MESNVEDVIEYSDISLNSELVTILKLNKAAKNKNKIHNIILMIDLGDLREGMLEEEVDFAISKIINLTNINLLGIGTNLTCYGGVIPDKNNLGKLILIKEKLIKKYSIDIPLVSGGNSSSLYLILEDKMPKGINNLRIGEAIVLGRETSYGKVVPNCYNDCFILKGEIVEIKNKPSFPVGTIGMDAFGNTPTFINKGIRKRAIIAIGRQDVDIVGLYPRDKNIKILGASSDYLISDITDCKNKYNVGQILEFTMNYSCLLRTMTSPYVNKYYG